MSVPILRTIACIMIVLFGTNTVFAPVSYAQVAFLPAAGTMVPMTGKYNPVVIKGMQLYPDNPFKFDFIVDTGDTNLSQEALKEEGQKLIGYFLASLTTPEKDMWVNLSPYEKDRIIPTAFGDTQMGKELLAQDYLLKQIMATALYPQRELGRQFWQKVYSEAQAKFGTTNVPVNTFNKVWILPDKAMVYENSRMNSVFVVESSLKVMLEQDYLAEAVNSKLLMVNGQKQRDQKTTNTTTINNSPSTINQLGSQIIREIVIPALQKEVNEGRNFAPLRQVYQSLILAAWYKKNLKDNVIAQAYVDRNKTKGVDVADKNITQKIYKQYLQAYRKGVYNFIKEDIDAATQTEVPRKYFSGGENFAMMATLVQSTNNPAMAAPLIKKGGGEWKEFQVVLENIYNDAKATGVRAAYRRLLFKTMTSLLAATVAFSIGAGVGEGLKNYGSKAEFVWIVESSHVLFMLRQYLNNVREAFSESRPAAATRQKEIPDRLATDIHMPSFFNYDFKAFRYWYDTDYQFQLSEYIVNYYAMLPEPAVEPVPEPLHKRKLRRKSPAFHPKISVGRKGESFFDAVRRTATPEELKELEIPPEGDRAMKGGINLEKVNVNTRGGGVRTAFSDPAQLQMLLKADGLVPVIYKIQPLTVQMINMLLGL